MDEGAQIYGYLRVNTGKYVQQHTPVDKGMAAPRSATKTLEM